MARLAAQRAAIKKKRLLHQLPPNPLQAANPANQPTTANAAAVSAVPSAANALTAPPAPPASGSTFDVRV
jgi:hypothetical protein